VKDAAAYLHGSAHDGERVFRHLTLPSYEKAIKEACEALVLNALRIVPHCFRHTGPSTDAYLKALSIQQIQDRGTWKCPASVRRYEKHATLLRQLHKMTARQRRDAIAAGRQLPGLLKNAFRQYR
jgi:integrase